MDVYFWGAIAGAQAAVLAGVAAAVFWRRGREAMRCNTGLQDRCDEAAEALQQARALIEGDVDTTASVSEWLAERAAACNGDDTTSRLQRLVFQNELDPTDELLDFVQILGGSGADTLRTLWVQRRGEMRTEIEALRAEYPDLADPIARVFDTLNDIDDHFGLAFEAFAPPETGQGDAPADPTEELVGLREQVIALQAQLEEAQSNTSPVLAQLESELAEARREADDLRAHVHTLEQALPEEQTDDELKRLLQQFTRDSRDMLACIQKLEQENLTLKGELEEAQSANA